MSGELAFIESLRALARDPAARNLDDDCAVLRIGGEALVLTHDTMAEGAHFRAGADLADVAWKLVSVNLSDLAAKGAIPIGVLLGYQLGKGDDRFVTGLGEVLGHFGVPLLGGDTIRAPDGRGFSLTAIGRATHLPVPDRRNARPGDSVWVTGVIGRAMLGFENDPRHLDAFNRPLPLLAEGRALAPLVGAMMDVSDGLLLDCWRMASAGGVTIGLDSAAIPVADPARPEACMRWGDDYELLFTAPRRAALPVPAARIGTVLERGKAPLLLDGRAPGGKLGYEHR